MDLKAFDQEKKSKKKIIIIASIFLIVAITFVVFSYSLYQKEDVGLVASGTVKRGTSVLKATSRWDSTEFRKYEYRSKIKNITIEDEINIRENKIEEWDISEAEDESIISYVVPNETEGYYDLYIQSNKYIEANPDMSYWFSDFQYLDTINGLEFLDTSNVTNMEGMFYQTGFYSIGFTLNLGSNFDTSNVTDMSSMFEETGKNSTVFTLDLGDKFDTSNVTDMLRMFSYIGYSNPNFTLDLGDKFNTSNVTSMYAMFEYTGYSSTNLTLDLGEKFDTSNVTSMSNMFASTGYSSTNFTLDLGNKFDTSKVTSMSSMFNGTGYSNPNFTLDVSRFDTSNVTDMSSMFNRTGYSNPNFTLDVSNFDTSKVTEISWMFWDTGYNSTKLNTTITIRNPINNSNCYLRMFEGVATKPGSKITVNYTKETSDLVDKMIATKSAESNVVKGVQVD